MILTLAQVDVIYRELGLFYDDAAEVALENTNMDGVVVATFNNGSKIIVSRDGKVMYL